MGSPLCLVITSFFVEDFEELAHEWAIHKPLSWFHYMDDTSVIWPHDPNRLRDFLNHLNNIQWNIQFVMEMERDSHLPFLAVDIYRRPGGSLGHKVYHKPTHTNLSLNSFSYHHPSNKHAVLPHLYMGLGLCMIETAFIWGWCSGGAFSGRTTTVTGRVTALNSLLRVAQPKDKPNSVAFLP
jgi:hypothetical protein